MAIGALTGKALPWTPTDNAKASRPGGPKWPKWLKTAAREPLLHFVLLGGAIFATSETIEHFTTQYRVVITPDRIQQLKDTYVLQYGTAPTPTQLQNLVGGYVKEEIEYRESLALGLDRDDEIVRRRLVQKYEFLQQDLQSLDDPSDQTLRAYYTAHAGSYGQAQTRSFTQVYFSPDNGGEDQAEHRAEAELKKLNASGAARAPDDGDAFPGPTDLADLNAGDTERLFGTSDLSRAVFTARPGAWAGPFRSGFGWHLIRVTGDKPATVQPYDQVASRVLDDWRATQRETLNTKTYATLKAKYNVVIEAAKK